MRALVAVVIALAIAPAALAATQVHYVMGTYLRVTVDGDAAPSAFDACFADARGLDRIFSRYDPTSELMQLNARGGGPASPELRRELVRALELGRATDGVFDVSVGALTGLWRGSRRPSAPEISAARATVGAVSLTTDGIALGPGTQLDFDGFAKGVAVDACVARLRAAGVASALVSFGESSIYALGTPRGESGWRLDVRGPDPDTVVARLRLRDEAASVSAVFGGEGRRPAAAIGHIVDPRSGRALEADVVGVVVAPRAADAEAFSKAILVWGEGGLARAERIAGVHAARIGRTRIARGARMRRSGMLAAFDRPRPLGIVEAALR